MSLGISLIVACVFAALCAGPLKRAPWLLYILAIVVAAAAIYLTFNPPASPLVRSIVFAVQKGQVGFALFAVVMFIGVLGRDSAVRRLLNPVRAELSIIAALLTVGHFVPYLSNYLGMASTLFSLRPNILSSLAIALILLVLLALLTVTSFNAVKRRMDSDRWKALQRLAYPFFGLIFFHMLGYLLVPALNGSGRATISVAVYVTIFSAYIVLRLRRAVRDRRGEIPAIVR